VALGIAGAALLTFLPPLLGEDGEPPWIRLKKNPPKKAEIQEEFETCMICHEVEEEAELAGGERLQLLVDPAKITASVHGNLLKCTACHEGYGIEEGGGEHKKTDAKNREEFRRSVEAACRKCHADTDRLYGGSVHHQAVEDVGCVRCHGGHEGKRFKGKPREINRSCGACHEEAAKAFRGSAHEKEGSTSCVSCHGAHKVRERRLDAIGEGALCGRCHEEEAKCLSGSVHEGAQVGCRSCHGNHTLKLGKGEKKATVKACGECHAPEAKAYAAGKHWKGEEGPGCLECHGHHQLKGTGSTPKEEAALCAACHPEAAKAFLENAHGRAPKGPRCSDCHGTHHTDWVETIPPVEVMNFCGRCHRTTAEEYRRNVHQIALEGGKEKSPHCVDCHGAHTMQPVMATGEDWARDFFLVECRKCHQTFCDLAEEHPNLPGLHSRSRHLLCRDCHVPREGTEGHILEAGIKPVLDCLRCHNRGTLMDWKRKDWDWSMRDFFPDSPYVVGADPIGGPDILGFFGVFLAVLGMPVGHGGLRILFGFLRSRKGETREDNRR
jgi:predicted CXXCH cytochrome family protein